MNATYIQQNLMELYKRLHTNIVILDHDINEQKYIDIDDEYMYEQSGTETDDLEQHF